MLSISGSLTLPYFRDNPLAMSDEHVPANRNEAFESELRSMLEAREREKDDQRQQTSKRFTIILIASAVVIAGAVMLFPSKSQEAVAPLVVKPLVPAASALPNPLNPDPNNTDPGLAHDLKPFSIDKDHLGGQSEDIRFAMQLMNFMDAPQLKKMLPIKEESEPPKKP